MRRSIMCLGLGLGLFFGITLQAGDYYVSGEALYWQPLTEGVEFGYTIAEADPFIADRVFANCPVYDWGGRVRVGGQFCRYYIEGSYLWYRSQSSRSAYATEDLLLISPRFLQPFDTLTGSSEDHYQTAYCRIGRYFRCRCSGQLQGFAQVRWGQVSERRKVSGLASRDPDPDARLFNQETPSFWGVGPGVGLRVQFPLCVCCLSVFSEVAVSALIGKGDYSNDVVKFEPGTEDLLVGRINWDRCSRVVPLGEFSLGLNYEFDCNCLKINLFAGYELHYLWGGIVYPPAAHGMIVDSPLGAINVGLQSVRMDIGFGGLTLGARCAF